MLWVWGARGGYAGPAGGLFANLADVFTARGITSLRLHYRRPSDYYESVLDARAGLEFLTQQGCERTVVVGHSFGGAVALTAGASSDRVTAVVALSSQTCGAQGAALVAPRPLLLVHGERDTRLPPMCSRMIYLAAQEPKELIVYPDAEHGLLECQEALHDLLGQWISDQLNVSEPD